MSINSLPNEIIYDILSKVVAANQDDGVLYTYGLSKLPESKDPRVPKKAQRYIRGPIPPYQLKWDAASKIRLVCAKWHSWSLAYAVSDVYVKNWRGSERWFDLTWDRAKYPLYEMVEYPKGEPCYRDPYSTLDNTRRLVENVPEAAASVRRLWFNGLYIPRTDETITAILRACPNVRIAAIPWTIVRHGSPADWAAILGCGNENPLRSLELHMITPSQLERKAIEVVPETHSIFSPAVDFSGLKRLKIIGDTDCLPITDADLRAIARTATNIEEFILTCTSTVTIDGVMAIVRASQKTLRILEHSPRGQHGFWHPDPGHTSDGAHICEILAACPRLEDVSVSLPSMCASLFSNERVRWRGDCQVRALGLCGVQDRRSMEGQIKLRELLAQSRRLIDARARGTLPASLTLELFYGECIFDPHLNVVHGDFEEGEIMSDGAWPARREVSRKGPYGSTGLYGKMEEEVAFYMIEENDFLSGLARNLVRLS